MTAFGNAHVVGGGFHPDRSTFFLLQDKVPGGTIGNQVAEVNPQTGAVSNSFSVAATFGINYGDLDVCEATGNLLLVSSDLTTIGEFTPAGVLVAQHPLPPDVTGLSGIAINDSTAGEAWVSGTSGTVWRLGGVPCD